MLSAKAAIQHSSVQRALSLTLPPMPTPSSIPGHSPGADVSIPDTHAQSMGLASTVQLQKPHTPPLPLQKSSFLLPSQTVTPEIFWAEASGAVRKGQSKPC